jgi:RNA polymerase sigma-70 factor (ECF subfamily)
MLDFENLYQTYAPEVYRFSFWLAGDSAEAEDITTETFIRAWTNSKPPRTETLKAYLFVIARNFYLEQKRKGKRQVALEEHYPDPSPGPEKVAETRIELQRIIVNLKTFPEVDQTAFILRVQHDFPYAEIARVLGISISSAKVKVHRVRKKLLSCYLKEEDP